MASDDVKPGFKEVTFVGNFLMRAIVPLTKRRVLTDHKRAWSKTKGNTHRNVEKTGFCGGVCLGGGFSGIGGVGCEGVGGGLR